MSAPIIQTAFVSGEVAPSLFGHVDLARTHVGASTMRNLFVSYRGGAYSRAGTAFVGFSKQTGRSYPPRLITFQFSINQGLALEFGNLYMRVISQGAFVIDSALTILGASQANPCVLTVSSSSNPTVTPNNGAVSASYAPGDSITLAGGVFSVAAVLNVTNTMLLTLSVNAAGSGWKPGDTLTLTGGTQSSQAKLQVLTTRVVSATLVNAGRWTGAHNATITVTGTTGTGVKFQASVDVSTENGIYLINSVTVPGAYTHNPTNLSSEPVAASNLSGATFSIQLGVEAVEIVSAGVFTANPSGGNFSQNTTSGSGTGATFKSAIMAPNALTFSTLGTYTVFPSNPVAQASTTGSGFGCTFTVISPPSLAFATGDWVSISGIGGMTELNGGTYVLTKIDSTHFSLSDVYGNAVDSTLFDAYSAGGVAARIYTLPTPYAEEDLPYLKFTQSADVMSICCWNQQTLTEYEPQDLSRITDSDWTFSPVVPAATIAPPASISGSSSSSGSVDYQYVVTSVSSEDGTESVASPIASINSAVDISSTAGTISLKWAAVLGVQQFNVYKATPGYSASPPAGSLFGYAGSAYGTQFIDSNIIADFSQVPPLHQNPFARGQVVSIKPTTVGTGYTNATAAITSANGAGVVITCIVQGGGVIAFIIDDPGSGYESGDAVVITGDGTGAAATATIGAQSGTYPGTVAYFQERRVYGSSQNNPDSYWMSQPGAFTNFDFRIPTISSDAITGSPWSVEVNGIQWMINMPGGLVVLTGLSAWQLVGSGSFSTSIQPITPSSQDAQPQAYNGCSAILPPIKIDYDIIYVQAKESIYRDLSYQFFTNIYTGADITEISSHLFTGFTMREHAWCEEPYKILWTVRQDGILLSLTFNKPEQVIGWSRHDTNGIFQSVCSVTEPPVDALYLAVQRFPGTNTAYMIERMNDRLWNAVEDCWCVDCGLELPQPEPAATLSVNTATGLGAIAGATGIVGGQNYSAGTTAAIIDNDGSGPGTGAVVALTISEGLITGIAISPEGSGYVNPALVISDPANTGSGASAELILDNSATFTATKPVFSASNVGDIIRMGGGAAIITSFTDSQHVVADILSPIVSLIPNSGGNVQPQTAGNWTMTTPVSTIGGLSHLVGATVTGLADGNVIAPTTVASDGTISLQNPASSVTVGLGYQAQLQSLYLDTGEPTVQGQRKKISAVTARVQSSRGLKIGTNQPDGSVLSPPQIEVKWKNLATVQDKAIAAYNGLTTPLYTGDVRIPVPGGFQTPGQVCLQQDNPLPMEILALINEVFPGDQPELQARPQNGGRR